MLIGHATLELFSNVAEIMNDEMVIKYFPYAPFNLPCNNLLTTLPS